MGIRALRSQATKGTVTKTAALLATVLLFAAGGRAGAQPSVLSAATLAPTNHPLLPRDLSRLWMVPEPGGARTKTQADFLAAVRLEVQGDFARALPMLIEPAQQRGPLAAYAAYYAGLAQLRTGRVDEARRTFRALDARAPVGYLAQAVLLGLAECAEAVNDYRGALEIYERLAAARTTGTDAILMRLARAARLAGNPDRATEAYIRVYTDYPLSDEALQAGLELLNGASPLAPPRLRLAIDHADRLFAARRYAAARAEFEALRSQAKGDDRELVDLRIAECDYFLKRTRAAKAALAPYTARASRQAEALFFYAASLRDLDEREEYVRTMRRIAAEFPTDPWAEDALDDLGTSYLVHDEDDRADEIFRELYARFPTGRHGERAAWKIGWRAYKRGDLAEAARVFDRAAGDFPRSDYRPMWLYWSGRAYARLDRSDLAAARFALAVADYANSYYGRLARKRLEEQGLRPPVRRLVVDVVGPADAAGGDPPRPAVPALPPTEGTIRALLALGLYDQAVDELRYAQAVWGTSPAIEATLAWTLWQQARGEKGMDRLTRARAAMNAMKRAYPHYLAAGGEDLPAELLRIIFPLAYWDEIRKYAAAYNLDPYLAAALVAQESTFVPDVRSYANAWGLTQLLPSTARQYAKVVNLRYTPKVLTDPDANLRIGLAYLAQTIKEFGSVPLALASYNAGERAVRRWMALHPGAPDDEFIDDIPYPQTNTYVKKILGTAEDYRRLYGVEPPPERLQAEATPAVSRAAAARAPAKASVRTVRRTKKAAVPTRAKVKPKRKARKAA